MQTACAVWRRGRGTDRGSRFARACAMRRRRGVPVAHSVQDDHRDDDQDGEPGDAALTIRHDDERGAERRHRLAEIAADLEHRLRQAVPPAGGHARHPRRLRVEHGRAHPDHRRGQQQHRVAMRPRQQQQSGQRAPHSHDERVGHRPPVGDRAHHGLQQGCRRHEGQRQETDLAEAQAVIRLQHRVDRWQQGLDKVVQAMRHADREQDGEHGARHARHQGRRTHIGRCHAHVHRCSPIGRPGVRPRAAGSPTIGRS